MESIWILWWLLGANLLTKISLWFGNIFKQYYRLIFMATLREIVKARLPMLLEQVGNLQLQVKGLAEAVEQNLTAQRAFRHSLDEKLASTLAHYTSSVKTLSRRIERKKRQLINQQLLRRVARGELRGPDVLKALENSGREAMWVSDGVTLRRKRLELGAGQTAGTTSKIQTWTTDGVGQRPEEIPIGVEAVRKALRGKKLGWQDTMVAVEAAKELEGAD